jgi:hypothetical protein
MIYNATFNNIQLYRGGQFYCWRKPENPEKTTDLSQVTDKLLSHNVEWSIPNLKWFRSLVIKPFLVIGVWHRHLFHSQNICPSSSLLQGKHLPFSPSPLRLNIFRLFVILSLTQLYRYTPEIFLFSTAATFKYTYRDPLRRIGQNYSAKVAWWKFKLLKRIQPLTVCAGFFICIRNSLDRPCVTMPSWSSHLKCKVSL